MAAGLALDGPDLLSRRFMHDLAGSHHDRVSGRSPELTATGAQRPSGRNTGLGRQAHIGHPVLVGSRYFAVDLASIWGAIGVHFQQSLRRFVQLPRWISGPFRIEFALKCVACLMVF